VRGIKSIFSLLVVLIIVFSQSAWAESLKMGGSGGMIPLMNELAKVFMKKNPGDNIEVLQKSLDAKGGIMGAYGGGLDIGLSARLLEPEEMSLNMTAIEIARVATVPGVNAASVKIKSITSGQICDIYSGMIKNWKELGGHDSQIKPLTRPEPDSTKKAVRKGLQCFSSLKEDSHVITMQTSREMIHALANAPNTVGFTDLVSVDDSAGKVAALNLDGISPSPENVISGKWPIVKNFVLVTKNEPAGLVNRFIGFVRSPQGAEIIKNQKAIAIK
jgi:phosphate transport system substrate-binding protein